MIGKSEREIFRPLLPRSEHIHHENKIEHIEEKIRRQEAIAGKLILNVEALVTVKQELWTEKQNDDQLELLQDLVL